MGVHRVRRALGFTLVGVLLVAAISFVSAQENTLFMAGPAAVVETSAGTLAVSAEAAAVAAADEGLKADVALHEEDTSMATAVAQAPAPVIPPAATSEEQTTAAAQPVLLSEREWSDGIKTIVECTGEVTRTCQVNVYGPNGEFILGRTISPSGEAADCSGPCLDSTGAALDASSLTRTQGAKIITHAGAPATPPAAEEATVPTETQAEPLHKEGE